jgi:hypothetical protein
MKTIRPLFAWVMAIALTSGCALSHDASDAHGEVALEGGIAWKALAKQHSQFVVNPKGRYVFNWSYNPSVITEKEKRLARFKLAAVQESSKNYKTNADFPTLAEMGDGLYVAGDPFISADSFGNILSIYKLDGEAPIVESYVDPTDPFFANPRKPSVMRADFVKSDAPVLLYNWRQNFLGFTSAVVRDGSKLQFVAVVDVMASQPLDILKFGKVDANTDVVALTKVLAPFAYAINALTRLNLETTTEFGYEARLLTYSYVTSTPDYIAKTRAIIQDPAFQGERCISESEFKDERSLTAGCLKDFARILIKSDFVNSYMSAAGAARMATAFGLLPATVVGDFDTALSDSVKSQAAFKSIVGYITENRVAIRDVFAKGHIQNIQVEPAQVSAWLKTGAGKFGNVMTAMQGATVRDDAGKSIGYLDPTTPLTRVLTDASKGTTKVIFKDRGKTVTGNVPVRGLGFGKIELNEDI